MKRAYLISILVGTVLSTGLLSAQENLEYQIPPSEIMELADVPLAPAVRMNYDKTRMVLLYRDAYKSIAELSQEELRLGGLRIDPVTNIGSRTRYYKEIRVQDIGTGTEAIEVSGMPEKPLLANFLWSPDYAHMAFTQTTATGVEIWVLDVTKAAARKLTDAKANANMGRPMYWLEDGKSLLVKMLAPERRALIDTKTAVPSGPTISVADGKKAQNRTYQDLLKNKNDEHNFEQLALSELVKIDLEAKEEKWLQTDMYRGISFSPDGNYIMITTVEKPFSYLVPYTRFPSKTSIYDHTGELVKVLLEVPLIEDLPQGFMAVRKGPRSFSWRSDMAASLVYAEALDGGDPASEVEYRDEVFQLDAPFDGEPRSILKTINRYSGVQWGREDLAIAVDYWWNTRNVKYYRFDPSVGNESAEVLFDRNYQDVYSDPGEPVMERNEFGSYVLSLKGNKAYLLGEGYTPEGQFPFLEEMDLVSMKKKRLYTSNIEGKLERLNNYDVRKRQLLVRIESPTDYPNYYFRDLKKNSLQQITGNVNPFASIQDVHKEVITYKRDDGLELSGTLYLPVGYDMEKKEKVPMILWAYPQEFKDKNSAGQSTANPNSFTYPYYGSAIYWVTRGYAILDDAAFPIVGEGDEEPNDSFRPQLVANAQAAIDAVDAMGYIDRERVAVGGHSYGAFMVANLLSHSDLFAAGIARSGAYNRTLTPFGFQSEERNYWEAPEVYYTMSPFMHAEKMKTPLLLIHGQADNNSGTYPLQSERYFNALKGLGATVRLVMLPKESHGYAARESILHMLWEQDSWLEKYVKNKE